MEIQDLTTGPTTTCVFCGKLKKVGVRGLGKFFACPACLGSPGAGPKRATKRAAER